MRVPLAWLREFVDVELSPEALADRLTLLGMEVKGIEAWGADWRNVVVGELLTVERHPRADRLSLTTVTTGSGEPLEIVCGATNIAPGQRVPVALPGAVLPGNRRIERTEKMGVVSNGMLCSGDELGMTGDADGILILPPGTPLGRAMTELFGDTVLDVDVKPNRGDALSILGLAREVAAVTGGPVRPPVTELVESGRPTAERLRVEVLDPELCPRFVGRWVSGVRIGPSPDWVQMRLMAAGQRPISNVVDASNYVMIELGKPIHVFDGSAVGDGRIIVRRAAAGERIETLDHVQRTLDPETLVIADPRGPIGIAGVMGGADSEVGEGTTEVAVESAIFDPVNIRRTAFRHGLRSDASLRFEKGQEFRLARVGADRTAALVADWAGGAIAPGAVDSNPVDPPSTRVAFRPARVNRLLGTSLTPQEQAGLLARVGIAAELAPPGTPITIAVGSKPLLLDAAPVETWFATVPTWRRDLAVEADVTEEIIRVRGYETVPAILPHTPMPGYRHSPLEVRDAVRQALAGAGLSEVVTLALVSPRSVEQFPPPVDDLLPDEPDQGAGGDPVHVTNPLSSQHSILRQSLLGSLLEVVSTNLRHGRDDVAIFEVGKGYGTGSGPGQLPREWWRLGLALTGSAEPPAWNRPARPYDLDDAKGLVELLCRQLGLPEPVYEPLAGDPNLHPGRSARVVAGSGLSGRLGELHPGTVADLDLRADRLIVAEIAIAGLAAGRLADARGATPSRFPAIGRDLAVVVADDRPAAAVATSIRAHAGGLLRSLELFDIYRGKPLEDTQKSLAWRLTFVSDVRTLIESEIDEAMAAVAGGLAQDVGGRLRG
jgi:phenylalanyl-tRNA synthetase beta chain